MITNITLFKENVSVTHYPVGFASDTDKCIFCKRSLEHIPHYSFYTNLNLARKAPDVFTRFSANSCPSCIEQIAHDPKPMELKIELGLL